MSTKTFTFTSDELKAVLFALKQDLEILDKQMEEEPSKETADEANMLSDIIERLQNG